MYRSCVELLKKNSIARGRALRNPYHTNLPTVPTERLFQVLLVYFAT